MIRYHGSSSASFFTGSRDFYTFRARVERTIYACIFSLSLFQSFPNRFSDFSLKKYYGGKKHTIKKYYDQLNLTIISHTRYLHDLLLQTFPFFFEKYNSQLLLKLNIKFLEKERRKKKPHLRHFPTPIIFLVSFAIRCKEKKRKKKWNAFLKFISYLKSRRRSNLSGRRRRRHALSLHPNASVGCLVPPPRDPTCGTTMEASPKIRGQFERLKRWIISEAMGGPRRLVNTALFSSPLYRRCYRPRHLPEIPLAAIYSQRIPNHDGR